MLTPFHCRQCLVVSSGILMAATHDGIIPLVIQDDGREFIFVMFPRTHLGKCYVFTIMVSHEMYHSYISSTYSRYVGTTIAQP